MKRGIGTSGVKRRGLEVMRVVNTRTNVLPIGLIKDLAGNRKESQAERGPSTDGVFFCEGVEIEQELGRGGIMLLNNAEKVELEISILKTSCPSK